jgi:excisionase family DNA binding protein
VISEANGNDLFEALIGRIADEVVKRIGQGTSPTEPAMLSPRSIATILDCSVSEVRRYLQTNGIPTVRFGKRGYRVPKEEFDKRLARWKKGGSLWD